MGEPTVNFHVQVRQTQFKIPAELIKKNFKSIQKLIEKQKKQLADDIAKINKNQSLPTKLKLQLVKKLIRGFEEFQRKLSDLIEKDKDYRDRLVTRNLHLQRLNDYTVQKETHKAGSSNGIGGIGDDGFDDADEEDDVDDDDEGDDMYDQMNDAGGADRTGNGGNIEKDAQPDKQADGNNGGELDLNNPSLITWYREETDLLILDYLIRSDIHMLQREGEPNAEKNLGIKLLQSLSTKFPDISKLIDYDVYQEFNTVYSSIIISHDLTAVISWFNENKQLLKKIHSNLEFEIKYCRLLSLIERNQVSDAIRYSQENLSMYGNKDNYSQEIELDHHRENLQKLKKIGSLLLYFSINETPNTFSSAVVINSEGYKEHETMLSRGRWDSLAKCFLDNFTKLYGISKNYPLFIYLSAGMSSLKTKSCYCNKENTIYNKVDEDADKDTSDNKTPKPLAISKRFRGPNQYYHLLKKVNNCPVCAPELFALSKNLPYAQLITKIFNNPVKLPNGNIYPFDKLVQVNISKTLKSKQITSVVDLLEVGKIQDPLTREIFNMDECVRVYPA